MTIYVLTALINAVASFILGVFVYSKNKKAAINKTFMLFAFAVCFWSSSYFIWQIAKSPESALFWSRTLIIGAIFIPIFYFHFVLFLLDAYKEKRRVLAFGYALALIFFLLNFTPLMVKGVVSKFSFSYWPEPGLAFPFFLLMFFGYVIYSWYLMFLAYQKLTGIKREQIKYVLIGTFIGFFGGSTNYFLWYDVPVLPLGNGLVAIYVALVAVAIVKYRLMNIRVIVTEFLVALIAFVLFIEAILSETLYEGLFRGGLFIVFCFFGYLLIKSVLNEIKRREELENIATKLKKAYEELKKLDRAKSEFISIASHQLRTPLTIIKGYISMLIEGTYGRLTKKAQKVIGNVYKSNERLLRLINDLLNVSRIETGRIELDKREVSLDDIILAITNELKITVKEKGLYLKFKKPSKPLPKIIIDGDKIRQVILNIIDNAIRYTNKGGIIVKIQNPQSKIQIIISDTGEGMTREEISELFKRFSRGKAGVKLWTEGAGLGLYVAKKFVEMHQGRIWAESSGKEQGSTFYIELPYEKNS